MVGRRAPLLRRARGSDDRADPVAPPFNGFGSAATGWGRASGAWSGWGPNPLINPHRRGGREPDMIFQNPMFSRPKLAFGPCGEVPPSYMSLNHRNIAGV